MSDIPAYEFIYRQIRRTHRRGKLVLFWESMIQAFFYASLGVGSAVLLSKLTPWSLALSPALISVIIIFLVLLIFRFYSHRFPIRATAIRIDRRLHLKEKISSALELTSAVDEHGGEQEWRQALLLDAFESAKRIDPRRVFPWHNPSVLRWMWAPVLVFLLAYLAIPQWNLWSGNNRAAAALADKTQQAAAIEKLVQRQLVLQKRAEEKEADFAAEISQEIKKLAEQLSKGQIEQREALAKISSLEQKWEKQQQSLEEKLPAANLVQSASEPKLTKELTQDLQKGEYQKAAEQLQKFQKEFKMGNLSAEKKNSLAQEFHSLAQSLENQSALKDALNHAADNLNGGDLESAMKSLELAESSLMDSQKILEQTALLKQSLEDLKLSKLTMAGVPGQLSSGVLKGTMNLPPNGFSMIPANSTIGSGSSGGAVVGMGKGSGQVGGLSNTSQNGMGGPGQGRGGQMPFESTSTAFQTGRLPSDFISAPIQDIVSVKGEPTQGNSTAQFNQPNFQYRQAAEEALVKERIPLPYRAHVYTYFNTMTHSTNNTSDTESSEVGDKSNLPQNKEN